MRPSALGIPIHRWRISPGKSLRASLRGLGSSVRFRISTLMLLTAIVAMAFAWRQDHRHLTKQLDQLRNPGPHWETSEVTGAPDTTKAGDLPTAWASLTPDNQREWLVLEYAIAIVPTAILVHETFNPGAVYKATHFPRFGSERVLWAGADPTPTTAKQGVSRLPVSATVKTDRIKIYIDSPAVPGWNEIDAVGLVHGDGQVIWAVRASASSSYGDRADRSNFTTRFVW